MKKKKEIQRSSSFTHAHMHPEDWHKDKHDIKCAFESILFESIKANRIAKGAGWLAAGWLLEIHTLHILLHFGELVWTVIATDGFPTLFALNHVYNEDDDDRIDNDDNDESDKDGNGVDVDEHRTSHTVV